MVIGSKEFYIENKLNPVEYEHIMISTLPFSIRVANRLQSLKIENVADLLKLKEKDLLTISGFGLKCRREIYDYIDTLVIENNTKQKTTISIPNVMYQHIEEIMSNDFGFLDTLKFDDAIEKFTVAIGEAFETIDENIINACVSEADYIKSISYALRQFCKIIDKYSDIKRDIRAINIERLSNAAIFYIKAFSNSEEVYNALTKNVDENISLEGLIDVICKDTSINPIYNSFLFWLSFDIEKELTCFVNELKKNEREYDVIHMRAQKKTLEEVGKFFNVTRERVRQIEAKVMRKFYVWQNGSRILHKIYADRNGDNVLTAIELVEYFRDNHDLFMFLFKSKTDSDVVYDRQLDAFIISDEKMPERVQSYVDQLPETFDDAKKEEYIKTAVGDYILSEKLLRLSIEENYQKTGEVYHRSKLSLSNLYYDILNRYYPEGIHIYDENEIKVFKQYIKNDYDIELEQTDHAIGAVISRIGILSGRGTYRLNNKSFISQTLAEKIYDYINSSDMPVFMTNSLYAIFEEELLSEGIDNKYFLQGVLRDLYGDKWSFRRDYVSKDPSITSVYTSVVAYIKNSKYPVRKSEIYNAFPGITEIVINIAVSDSDVINLFGSYMHVDNMKITDSDLRYFEDVIEMFIERKDVWHCKHLYDYIVRDYPSVLSNNFITMPFSLCSLFENLFMEKYVISRPFLAKKGTKIEKTYDVLREMVSNSDIMEISTIASYSRKNFHQINSILDFLDSCNDTHLLINSDEIASIEIIGLNDEIVRNIESIIADEVKDTMPISRLQCVAKLPKLNVDWNEWLIYSIINKWGEFLEVAASANQFKQSVPLISRKGLMNTSDFENVLYEDVGSLISVDNLDNIDELISDYIFEDGILDDI